VKASAELVTFTEDDTPYLWRKAIGKVVWRVVLHNATLKLKSGLPDSQDRYHRRFVLLLEESTGRMLRIDSKYDGPVDEMRPPPSGPSAERQLQAEGEVYQGYPESGPLHTFLGALDIVLAQGIGSPFLAKEISGVYVMESRAGEPFRPAWVISMRGLPPLPNRGPQGVVVPEWQRNHMRNVVDDISGKVLFATNGPQPLP
jgi:hypothetical protein